MNYQEFYTSIIKTPMPLRVREALADSLANQKRKDNFETWSKLIENSSYLSKYVESIKFHGFLPIELPESVELANTLCKIPHDPPSKTSNSELIELKNVSGLPVVKSILRSERLYKIVSLYLGAPAYLHACQAWWQYPMSEDHPASNAQQWHRDRDDLRELKLFFYATDVDAKSGPHGYIPRSHNSSALKEIFEYPNQYPKIIEGEKHIFLSDNDLLSLRPKVKPKMWLGKAGTCFLEDTSGFHRAYVPTSKPRLIFNLTWTLGPGWKR